MAVETLFNEDEDRDPVGPARDPREVFTALAVQHGLIRPVDKLDRNMIDFATAVVDLCATNGDRYGDVDCNAGDHIRAEYYD
ncbi:MAG: hypothetical protein H7340_03340 [Variovorax sp.]|nr:hypothetical protein [Variovorax sp.]